MVMRFKVQYLLCFVSLFLFPLFCPLSYGANDHVDQAKIILRKSSGRVASFFIDRATLITGFPDIAGFDPLAPGDSSIKVSSSSRLKKKKNISRRSKKANRKKRAKKKQSRKITYTKPYIPERPIGMYPLEEERASLGIILTFHKWPVSKRTRQRILKLTREKELGNSQFFSQMKVWSLSWPFPMTDADVAEVCDEIERLFSSEVKYCDPNNLLKFDQKKKVKQRHSLLP